MPLQLKRSKIRLNFLTKFCQKFSTGARAESHAEGAPILAGVVLAVHRVHDRGPLGGGPPRRDTGASVLCPFLERKLCKHLILSKTPMTKAFILSHARLDLRQGNWEEPRARGPRAASWGSTRSGRRGRRASPSSGRTSRFGLPGPTRARRLRENSPAFRSR